jgi:hypothetical protein
MDQDQVPFGFPETKPVTITVELIQEPQLDDVWIAYLTLPYKNILEYTDSGEIVVLGKALGFVAQVFCGFTNEMDCFLLRGDHCHLVWQADDFVYRCCHGLPKYAELDDDDDLKWAEMLDRVVDGLPLITRLVVEDRNATS